MHPAHPIDLNELGNRVQDIFPMPVILEKILHAVNDPNVSVAAIENIFKYEPSLTLQILTLANSAYFGAAEKITNIRSAITLLGLNLIKSLAIHASVNELFRFGTTLPSFSGYELWKHSVGVAVASKLIARRSRLDNVEDYFTLGILHDVGLIIEYQFYREPFIAILSHLPAEMNDLPEMERKYLGTDHAELAKLLCLRWQLPELMAQVLAHHHSPSQAPENLRRQVYAIYLADNIVRGKNFGFGTPAETPTPESLAALALMPADLRAVADEFDQEITAMTIFLQ
jgi:HD-like signal output (HDOD) protein